MVAAVVKVLTFPVLKLFICTLQLDCKRAEYRANLKTGAAGAGLNSKILNVKGNIPQEEVSENRSKNRLVQGQENKTGVKKVSKLKTKVTNE